MGSKITDDKKQLIEKAVNNAMMIIREHPAQKIALVAYITNEDFQQVSPGEFEVLQSADTHYKILKKVQAQVAREFNKEVILVPFDLEDYTQWLSSKQLENSQAHRGTWAAIKAGLVN